MLAQLRRILNFDQVKGMKLETLTTKWMQRVGNSNLQLLSCTVANEHIHFLSNKQHLTILVMVCQRKRYSHTYDKRSSSA